MVNSERLEVKIVKLDNGKYGYWNKIDGYLEDQADTLEDAIRDAFLLWGTGWSMSDIDENHCFTIDIACSSAELSQ